LPKNLSRGKQRLAIDLVLIPYHGQPFCNESEIDRSQPKSGTSLFHAYATVAWFGIETCYRQRHECRIRTNTHRPILRLLYVALAMVMRNYWIRICLFRSKIIPRSSQNQSLYYLDFAYKSSKKNFANF
jgi:hypothetical protein